MSKFINSLEEGVISLLLVAMTVLVFVETLLRYVFLIGISWAEEATLLLGAWLVLFGAAYGIKVGSHIGVDALVRLFPRGLRRVVTGVAVLAALGYCGLFLWGSWEHLDMMYLLDIPLEDVPIPRWMADSVLMVGFGLMAMRLLTLLWQVVTDQVDGFAMADEAKEAIEQLGQHHGEEK